MSLERTGQGAEHFRARWDAIGRGLAEGTAPDAGSLREAADLLARLGGPAVEASLAPIWESPFPMAIFDPETGRFLAVNRAGTSLYGYSEEELLGMTVFDVHTPDDLAALRERLRIVREGGTPRPEDVWRHRRRDGSTILAEVQGHWILFRGRRARLVMVRDVTARESALQALRLSEERFKLVARASKDAVWDWDLLAGTLWWSEGINSLFGYANAEPSIRWWIERIHPEDRDRVDRSFHGVVDSGRVYWSDEYRFGRADGSYAFVYDRGYVIHSEAGRPVRMVGGITDLSAWHSTQEALRRSEERFQLISRATNDAVWDWDLASDNVWYNEAFHRLFRYRPSEVRSAFDWRTARMAEEDREGHRLAIEAALAGSAEVHRAEYRFRRGDGTWASVFDRAVILRDERGRATRLVGSMKDESEREETLRQLAASESKFRRLFSSDLIGVVFSDTNGDVVEANDYFLRLVGYSREELQRGDLRWDMLTPPEFAPLDQKAVADLIARGRCEPFEKEYLHRSGSRVPVVIGAAMLEGEATRTVAFVLDNAEKVAGRRALEQANQDLERRVHERTRELETLYVRQAAVAELELAVNEPDDLGLVLKRLRWHLQALLPARAGAAVLLGPGLTEDLPGLDPEVLGLSPDAGLCTSAIMSETMDEGRTCVIEDTGESLVWSDRLVPDRAVGALAAVPLQAGAERLGCLVAFDPEPRVFAPADLEFLGVLGHRAAQAFIRARLTARLRRANEELRRAKEAADLARQEADAANHAKSEFISRMSHELRTPLNAILGFAQLLQLHSPTPEQAAQISQIVSGGRHLLTLINEVLDIARIEAGRMSVSLEPTSVGEALREAVQMIRPSLQARGITVDWESESVALWAVADANRLRQVLLNLLSNATKYNREGGSIRLAIESTCEGRVTVVIADTGVGISEEKMRRLFVPFDRLGMEGSTIEGSGLGLALSRRLADIMKGSLRLESAPGHGTRAILELMQAEAPGPGPESGMHPGASADSPSHGPIGRTVLYVEDNAANVALIDRIFSLSPGIRLLTAREGGRGLAIAAEEKPDLILLDLNLPDLDGASVLQQLRANADTAAIPVIIVSADALPGQRERLCDAGAYDYITKPFNVLEFLATIRRVLGTY